MTSTKQDNELREKLTKLISQDGWVDPYEVDVDGQVNELFAIITADRKRVALEARIDELLHLDDESIGTDWRANEWLSVSDRMAELKAQLEQLNDQL